jgi:hypothetical protein
VSELELVEALRRGDEQAFMTLVDRHGPSMLRLARVYVRDRAVAEEVVQEADTVALPGIPTVDPWHPAPGLRNRDLHARRRLPASGLQRGGGFITDGDTQWMTAGAGLSIC